VSPVDWAFARFSETTRMRVDCASRPAAATRSEAVNGSITRLAFHARHPHAVEGLHDADVEGVVARNLAGLDQLLLDADVVTVAGDVPASRRVHRAGAHRRAFEREMSGIGGDHRKLRL